MTIKHFPNLSPYENKETVWCNLLLDDEKQEATINVDQLAALR